MTLATTSLLLLNQHSVLADEQPVEETVVQTSSVDSSVVDEKTEASTTATSSETSSETEESEAAADETKEEASKADETSSKEQEPSSAFAEKTESLPSQLSKNDLTKVQELHAKTEKGSGQVIAIIDDAFDPAHDVFKLDKQLQGQPMSTVKRYDEEFKQSLVNLYQTGKTQSELCKDYGVSASALAKWIKQYSQVKLEDNSVLTAKQIQELQKRNAQLEEENLILKKASAIFMQNLK
ncbi:transposase [Streptococcus dysgalactiae subsp. equisimilis]|uniref:Transposase n=9 Tax=Streptococcus TaxID=1301 RepID=A0AAE9U5H5_STREQ|nr:transposase [Streptococcus dysgalactiae subsp. equisimilis]VTT16422.1 transposase [Streptococcus dysgalactiae]VTT20415.1 transposase [Streptococcus dysgalactiae subsp. equisimilis]VTT24845.1 transposase [Streptococcus dysgalactiae subsp. equisimilis]